MQLSLIFQHFCSLKFRTCRCSNLPTVECGAKRTESALMKQTFNTWKIIGQRAANKCFCFFFFGHRFYWRKLKINFISDATRCKLYFFLREKNISVLKLDYLVIEPLVLCVFVFVSDIFSQESDGHMSTKRRHQRQHFMQLDPNWWM